jgi:hypothetical protein
MPVKLLPNRPKNNGLCQFFLMGFTDLIISDFTGSLTDPSMQPPTYNWAHNNRHGRD